MKPKFFDVHSHISFSDFKKDYHDVIARMRKKNVWTITVGVDKKSSDRAVTFTQQYEEVYAAIGLHPADNTKETFDPNFYNFLAKNKKVVAIGECGLDYFRIKEGDTKEKDRQKKEFENQIKFALEVDLPLMLHCRPSDGKMDAYEDVLEILERYKKDHGDKLRGNSHFFTGSTEIAERFLKIGFALSFTGVITFTEDYDEIVRLTPMDMILIETDAPYVAPKPYRGKRNEPSYVVEVAKRIAEIKGMNAEVVREKLVENSLRIFNIPV